MKKQLLASVVAAVGLIVGRGGSGSDRIHHRTGGGYDQDRSDGSTHRFLG